MHPKRIYHPMVEEQASMFPRLDISDVEGTRATLNEFLEALAAKGVERPTDDRIEEIERTIPGPDGAPDVPIRIYMPKDRSKQGRVLLISMGADLYRAIWNQNMFAV